VTVARANIMGCTLRPLQDEVDARKEKLIDEIESTETENNNRSGVSGKMENRVACWAVV
jgi:hypothetical protein